jgi:hypothetical protein
MAATSSEQSEPDFRLALERRNLAVALPKFNVVAVDKLLRLFHDLIVVDADRRDRFTKMTVITDKICAIFRGVAAPNGSGGSITELAEDSASVFAYRALKRPVSSEPDISLRSGCDSFYRFFRILAYFR